MSVTFDFGDGTPPVPGSGTPPVATHAYATPGVYLVTALSDDTVVGQQSVSVPFWGEPDGFDPRIFGATTTDGLAANGPPYGPGSGMNAAMLTAVTTDGTLDTWESYWPPGAVYARLMIDCQPASESTFNGTGAGQGPNDPALGTDFDAIEVPRSSYVVRAFDTTAGVHDVAIVYYDIDGQVLGSIHAPFTVDPVDLLFSVWDSGGNVGQGASAVTVAFRDGNAAAPNAIPWTYLGSLYSDLVRYRITASGVVGAWTGPTPPEANIDTLWSAWMTPTGATATGLVGTQTFTIEGLDIGGAVLFTYQADYTVSAAFDPGAHTVAEVIDYADIHPDEVQALYDAEVAGRNRVTLLTALEERGAT